MFRTVLLIGTGCLAFVACDATRHSTEGNETPGSPHDHPQKEHDHDHSDHGHDNAQEAPQEEHGHDHNDQGLDHAQHASDQGDDYAQHISESGVCGGHISFSIEQQNRVGLELVTVVSRDIHNSVPATAELRPRSDGEVVIAAPVAGRLVSAGGAFPRFGSKVEAGDEVVIIAPTIGGEADLPTLELEVARSQADVKLAITETERLQQLWSDGAIPEKRLQAAQRDETRAKAELSAAARRLSRFQRLKHSKTTKADGITVQSPISGVLVEVSVTPGEFMSAGQSMFRVVDLNLLWLVAHVSETDLGRVSLGDGVWFSPVGDENMTHLGADALVAKGGVVDPHTRTVPFVFEVPNPSHRLKVGLAADAQILTGNAVNGPSIPLSSVIREGREAYVFVQLGKETFERRFVRIVKQEGTWALVEHGLSLGDLVVSKGAFSLKLASSGPQEAGHGHVH